VILAAGRGTRMAGLTADRPKAMLPLRNRPMLELILERLRLAGFLEILVVTGYRAEMIEEHFAVDSPALRFRRQEELNGTARAALLAREFTGAEPFLLTFGDILTGVEDYRAMARMLEEDAAAEAVLAAKWVEDPWQGAAVYEDRGVVTRIVEKPVRGASTTHWNSAGSYCFRASIFEELERVPLSPRGEYELTSAIEQLLARRVRVLLCGLHGGWRDVGRPEDLEEAEGMV